MPLLYANKENASDKFEIILKQVDDTTLIYGTLQRLCAAKITHTN